MPAVLLTDTFVVDNAGLDDPIIVPGTLQGCCSIVIRENGGALTTGFTIRAPLISSDAVTFLAGEPWTIFRASGFKSGETIGFIKTTDVASATFSFVGV